SSSNFEIDPDPVKLHPIRDRRCHHARSNPSRTMAWLRAGLQQPPSESMTAARCCLALVRSSRESPLLSQSPFSLREPLPSESPLLPITERCLVCPLVVRE